MTKTNFARIVVILLFVITFTTVGWAAPVLYASHAPESEFIEVHGFEAQNTTTTADHHNVCFDRTIHTSASGEIFTELYLVDENDDRKIQVETKSMDRYFQPGNKEIVTPLALPDDIVEGEYRYLLIVRMELSDGRVTRDFTYTSDTFVASDEVKYNSTPISTTC